MTHAQTDGPPGPCHSPIRYTLLATLTLALLAIGLTPPPAAAQSQFSNVVGDKLIGGQESASAIADLDGDGDMDIVVAGIDTNNAGDEKVYTTIYENTNDNSDPTDELKHSDFQEVTGTNLTGVRNGDVALGDLDGDGDPDLVITGNATAPYGDDPKTKIYENTDDNGTLEGADFDGNAIGASLPGLQGQATANLADFDSDGDLDLLLTGQQGFSGGRTALYENTDDNNSLGSGDFQEVPNVSNLTDVEEGDTDVGDVDGDGDPDIVLTGSTAGGAVSVIYDNTDDGDETLDGSDFSAVSNAISTPFNNSSVSLGDLDGDGDLDIFVTGNEPTGGNTSNWVAEIYANADDNGTIEAADFSTIGAPLTVTNFGTSRFGDLDGDGDPDLLVVGQTKTSPFLDATVYRNDYSGGSLSGSDLTALSNTGLRAMEKGSSAIHDFDGDGDNDLLLTGNDDEGSTELNPVVAVYDNPGDDALPVELTSFAVQQSGKKALLTWHTASETNNAGFAVQRKIGDSFRKIGFRNGAGTTTEAQSYRFRTERLGAGTHTFRLKQINTDGSASYSDPTRVQIGIEGSYRLGAPSPNPTSGTASLRLTVKTKQRVQVTVYDLLGRKVRTVYDGPMAAEQKHSLRLGSGLSTGTYLVRIQGAGFSTTERLTIAR